MHKPSTYSQSTPHVSLWISIPKIASSLQEKAPKLHQLANSRRIIVLSVILGSLFVSTALDQLAQHRKVEQVGYEQTANISTRQKELYLESLDHALVPNPRNGPNYNAIGLTIPNTENTSVPKYISYTDTTNPHESLIIYGLIYE